MHHNFFYKYSKCPEIHTCISTHRFQPDLPELPCTLWFQIPKLSGVENERGINCVERAIKFNHPQIQLGCHLFSWANIYWAPARYCRCTENTGRSPSPCSLPKSFRSSPLPALPCTFICSWGSAPRGVLVHALPWWVMCCFWARNFKRSIHIQ